MKNIGELSTYLRAQSEARKEEMATLMKEQADLLMIDMRKHVRAGLLTIQSDFDQHVNKLGKELVSVEARTESLATKLRQKWLAALMTGLLALIGMIGMGFLTIYLIRSSVNGLIRERETLAKEVVHYRQQLEQASGFIANLPKNIRVVKKQSGLLLEIESKEGLKGLSPYETVDGKVILNIQR